MRFFLILSWAAALSLAAPEIPPAHRHTVDDNDIILRRHSVDDSDIVLKTRAIEKAAQESHSSTASSTRHYGCYVLSFFRSAPHYISESLGRLETAGANSGLLPIFWFTGDKKSKTSVKDAQPSDPTFLEDDDHTSAWIELDEEQIKALLEEEAGLHNTTTRRRSPAARFLHAVMVWAHILSFSLLIFFTFVYATAFVLRKRLPNSPELRDQKLPLMEEV